MTKARRFRPAGDQKLEERCVPSGFAHHVEVSLSLPAQAVKMIRTDFNTFENAYAKEIRQFSKPGGDPNFTANVTADLMALDQAIASDVSKLSNSATLVPAINAQLLGDPTSSSLQATLGNLIEPPLGASRKAIRAFAQESNQAISQTENSILKLVQFPAKPPNTLAHLTPFAAIAAVHGSYGTFSDAYSTAFDTYLSALHDGTSQPVAAAAFTATAQSLENQLNTGVFLAVENNLSGLPLPQRQRLESNLTNALLDTPSSTGNLQNDLAAITLPSKSGQFFSDLIYRLRSDATITASEVRIDAMITYAVIQYNNSL